MSASNRPLYRHPHQGRIAGVCAGIADRFGLETWLVRIVAFSALLLSGGFIFILLAYLAAWALLPCLPEQSSEPNHASSSKLKTQTWQAGESPRVVFRELGQQFERLEQRIAVLEQHVVTDVFDLRREIDNLK